MAVRLRVSSCWGDGPGLEAIYEFDQSRILIGRAQGADICLPHPAVSLRHASIELKGQRYSLLDHHSTNGCALGVGSILAGRPKVLRDGDRIELGGFTIVFHCGVAISHATSSERTASLARRLVQERLNGEKEPVRVLEVLNGPQAGDTLSLPAPPSRLLLGRGEECGLVLDDAEASREHAELEVDLDGVLLHDLNSKNGLTVGGRPALTRRLGDGDEFRIGDTHLRFEDPTFAALEEAISAEDLSIDPPTWADVAPADEEAPEPPISEDSSSELTAPEPDVQVSAERGASEEAPVAQNRLATVDVLIYVLASTVFALSLLGLIWLLRS